MLDDGKCYRDWRRSEAYQIPMSEKGQELAAQRYEEFKRGWYYGIKRAASLLENMHTENKHTHKFYLFGSQKIREEIK